jgi:phosphoenolpyruvate-protein kinase (PTS system EI component)
MIRRAGTAFGFGRRVGVTVSDPKGALRAALPRGIGEIYLLRTIPTCRELDQMATMANVQCIVMPVCSQYSHDAARIWESGLPAIAVAQVEKIEVGAIACVELDDGIVYVAESPGDQTELIARGAEQSASPPTCSPKVRVHKSDISILAEVGSVRGLQRALASGADGLGVTAADVFWSESWPAERMRLSAEGGESLPRLVRFFDLPRPEMRAASECLSDTYLGQRGIRLLERRGELLEELCSRLVGQGLDAASTTIVFPMVTDVHEVASVRERLGKEWGGVGITIETPAAALQCAALLGECDFVEIGLNDLTQYTMAWSRDAPHDRRMPTARVAEPVARLLGEVIALCNARDKPYSLGLDLRPTRELVDQLRGLRVRTIACLPALVDAWRGALADVRPGD